MSIFTRGRHDGRHIPAQTPLPPQRTAGSPPWETAPFPAYTDPGPRVPAAARPYVKPDPLTAPHIPITEDCGTRLPAFRPGTGPRDLSAACCAHRLAGPAGRLPGPAP